ncbi:MAG: cytochrome-c peroxidase [Planctomycetota bacterium]|jgi:cytochrome c peroxidase
MQRTRRALPLGAYAGLFLLVLAVAGLSTAGEREGAPIGPHGAATMEHQQKVLGTLLPVRDLTKSPTGFDPVIWAAFIPEDNALTPERVELGRRLYFEIRLSKDKTVSCATCHDVTRGFTDQRKVSEGVRGRTGTRNAPTTLNVALLQTLFLDGRAASLEEQARLPILNPVEMAMPDAETAMAAIADDPEYKALFRKAYGRAPNYEDLGKAIAAFERTLVFADTPFQRFLDGDGKAISDSAKRGWDLFQTKARCITCHPINPSFPLGTDNRFHNIGVSARHQDFEALARKALKALAQDDSAQALDELALGSDLGELGRFLVSRARADIGAFRTSLLLNIGITPPYMHDGTMNTLWDVMDHYNKGGEPNPFLDGGIEPLALNEAEIDDVVAFLFTLTDGRFRAENDRQMRSQRERAGKERPFRDDAVANREVLPFERRVFGDSAEGK